MEGNGEGNGEWNGEWNGEGNGEWKEEQKCPTRMVGHLWMDIDCQYIRTLLVGGVVPQPLQHVLLG